jgi:hypothetical protein
MKAEGVAVTKLLQDLEGSGGVMPCDFVTDGRGPSRPLRAYAWLLLAPGWLLRASAEQVGSSGTWREVVWARGRRRPVSPSHWWSSRL